MLLSINTDVLGLILQETDAANALLPLSMTCKHMRSYCMPLLFHSCRICTEMPMSEMPIPSSLWPYIRSITFEDECYVWHARTRISEHNREFPYDSEYVPDLLQCVVYDPAILGTALRAMGSLCSVSFKLQERWKHGIPWSVIEAVLTVPHLRDFSCNGHAFAPRATLPQTTQAFASHVALTSFRHSRPDYRRMPRTYESEAAALRLVLRKLHGSLEILELPAESAPLSGILELSWPCLRELKLRGELDLAAACLEPPISALARMSALRNLDLRISSPVGASQTIWPAGYQAKWPWPHLQHLTLSFPSVDDQILQHLPDTLRSLNLQYYPHLSTDMWQKETEAVRMWRFPPSTSSDILRILRACPTAYLDRLELEYHQDDTEENLLQHIAATFPLLTFLKIRRYRQEDAPAVDLERFARPLCSLVQLRTLCLHLDLPDTPLPRFYPQSLYYALMDSDVWEFMTTLERIASTLAPLLSPSVEVLRLARPRSYAAEYSWAVYRINRESATEAEEEVGAQYDPEMSYDSPDEETSSSTDDSEHRTRGSSLSEPDSWVPLPDPYTTPLPGFFRRFMARIGRLSRGSICG